VGQLTTGHAKILKGITDPERQIAVSKEIIARGLSVHATESFLKAGSPDEKEGNANKPKPASEKTAHVQGVEDELRQKLSVRVEVRVRGTDKGQIILGFESNDDFERLLEVLRR
jgi:ParB family chromosome partitioning protein